VVSILGAFDLLYSVSGLVVGVIVGLTGVGGGSLMTPLLVLLFGVHPATAVGTDLLYASITKAAGVGVHGGNRTVDWQIAGRLAMGSLPAAALTIFALQRLGVASSGASAIITAVLGGALILTSVSLVFRRPIIAFAAAHAGDLTPRRAARLTVVTGVFLGVLVSVSSVGAGAIGMTALIFLYPRHPMVRLVGADIAHAVPLTLIAGLGHLMIGSIDWFILRSLLLGSLPGIVIGSYLSARVSDALLRYALAVTLAVVGARLVF
jgi:uncharacterized membrane protein YfcA